MSTTSLLQAQIFMLDFQAARWLVKGEVAEQAGNNHPTSIPTGVFKTADGHINIASTGQKIWERFCKAVGRAGAADEAGICERRRRARRTATRSTPRSTSYTVKRTSADWIERLNKAGVPCGPIYSIDQMFADPQVEHLGMAQPVKTQGQDATEAGRPADGAVAHAEQAACAHRRGSASIPTRCSRNSASAQSRSRRCARPTRYEN